MFDDFYSYSVDMANKMLFTDACKYLNCDEEILNMLIDKGILVPTQYGNTFYKSALDAVKDKLQKIKKKRADEIVVELLASKENIENIKKIHEQLAVRLRKEITCQICSIEAIGIFKVDNWFRLFLNTVGTLCLNDEEIKLIEDNLLLSSRDELPSLAEKMDCSYTELCERLGKAFDKLASITCADEANKLIGLVQHVKDLEDKNKNIKSKLEEMQNKFDELSKFFIAEKEIEYNKELSDIANCVQEPSQEKEQYWVNGIDIRNVGINTLHLSARTQNCLNNARIRTLYELVQISDDELMSIRGFGRKCYDEVVNVLKVHNLKRG